jgi:hypothetical protein
VAILEEIIARIRIQKARAAIFFIAIWVIEFMNTRARCVNNLRAATGQWACGFVVKVPHVGGKICATRWSPIFLLLISDRYRARFTPKPGPISQSPRSVIFFEGVKNRTALLRLAGRWLDIQHERWPEANATALGEPISSG